MCKEAEMRTLLLTHGQGYKKVNPLFVPRLLINLGAGHISIKHGFMVWIPIKLARYHGLTATGPESCGDNCLYDWCPFYRRRGQVHCLRRCRRDGCRGCRVLHPSASHWWFCESKKSSHGFQ